LIDIREGAWVAAGEMLKCSADGAALIAGTAAGAAAGRGGSTGCE
jgi:hypothetical protein